MVVSLLLAQSWAQTPITYAFDCEEDLYNAFLNANATYTTTFRSWYLGDPETCLTQCQNQCNQITDQTLKNQCIANLQTCVNNCNDTRYTAFTDAQDDLILATSQTCSYNPDFCDTARARRDDCVWTYNLEWQNPMLDGNGNVDENWSNMVSTQFSACWSASGVSQCE